MRTAYSFKSAAGNLEDVIERLKEIGYHHAPIVDNASTFGFVPWRALCDKEGLRPVYGIELAVTDMRMHKKPVIDYWQFIAKDSVVPLFRLLETATRQFRFEPLLTYDQLKDISDVYMVSGYRTQLDHIEPMDNLFIGLSVACSKGFVNQAKARGFKFAIRQENRFPTEADEPLYEMVCGRNADRKTFPQWILSDDEIRANLDRLFPVDEAFANRNFIYEQATASLPQGHLVSPPHDKSLREQCIEGAERLGIDISTGVYRERLDYELSIIEARKFEDYFYLVGDLMRHAKSENMVGPGRGSSAGSLVCWLIGITEVDPIKHNLLFERFLSLDRVGELPDCDLDMSEKGRNDGFDYLRKIYGQDHVAQIGSVSLFKEDAIFQELGKMFNIPKFECDDVLKYVEDYAAGDKHAAKVALDDLLTKHPKGIEFVRRYPSMANAPRLSSHPRHKTRHAAGAIVADKPITEYLGFDCHLDGVHANKEDVEALGHCKIDLLGLTQLSIFEMALELAQLPVDTLQKLPLDDTNAFDVLNNGKFSGVFQFAGHVLQQLTRQVKVTEFEDLVALTSLARPGPLDSGGAMRWVDCKNGKKEPSYLHPDLEPILKATKGVITYQEDAMRIVREIGGLDWAKVTKFRRAVSKSKGYDALREFEVEFRDGARSKDWDEETIDKVWNELVTFGKYGFCRAHAVAYSIVSYWSLWLKAYYPREYAAAMLQYQGAPEKQLAILKELASEGISYVPFDAELSSDRWNVVENRLIGPLQNVIGLGPKNVNIILSCRARNEPLPTKILKKLQGAKTKLDSLHPISDRMAKVDFTKLIVGALTPLSEIKADGTWKRDIYLCGEILSVEEQDENSPRKIADRESRGETGLLPGDPKSILVRIRDDQIEKFNLKVTAKKYCDFADYVLKLQEGDLIVAKVTILPMFEMGIIDKVKLIKESE